MGSLDRIIDEQIMLSMSGKAQRKAARQKAGLKLFKQTMKERESNLGVYKMKRVAKAGKIEASAKRSKKNSKEFDRAIAACYKHFK